MLTFSQRILSECKLNQPRRASLASSFSPRSCSPLCFRRPASNPTAKGFKGRPADGLLRPFSRFGELPLKKMDKSDQRVGRNVPPFKLQRFLCLDNRAFIHFCE